MSRCPRLSVAMLGIAVCNVAVFGQPSLAQGAASPPMHAAPNGGRAVSTVNPGAAAPSKLPEWDVISVKRIDLSNCTEGGGTQFTKDGIHAFCVPMLVMIEAAYEITDLNRIVGAPEWTKSGRFWNIDAKVAGEDVAAFAKLAPKDKDRMLQPLLEDRFHMKAHIEKREMSVYDLVVAKGGSKMKEASADDAARAFMGMHGPGKIEAVGMQLKNFLPTLLGHEAGRPVVDKTGLAGKYDFTLEYVPVSKAATDETGGPSIFTAVEEQLGLKLVPAKEPMDVLVVDSVEQPAAN